MPLPLFRGSSASKSHERQAFYTPLHEALSGELCIILALKCIPFCCNVFQNKPATDLTIVGSYSQSGLEIEKDKIVISVSVHAAWGPLVWPFFTKFWSDVCLNVLTGCTFPTVISPSHPRSKVMKSEIITPSYTGL